MADDWTLTPKVGVTYLRTIRDRVGEAGGPFALTVARDRHVTGFADAGVTFARSEASDAAFRPMSGSAPAPGSKGSGPMRSQAMPVHRRR